MSTLVETDLYLGDNGRVFCGRLRHAGMTAHFSGRDLSGQKVERLTPAAAERHGLACEACARDARRKP